MADASRKVAALWEPVIPQQERELLDAAGYGGRAGWGERPALLVVDVNYNFAGDRPLPIRESIRRFRNSCGEVAWETVPRIARLLALARSVGIPVFFTTQSLEEVSRRKLAGHPKNTRTLESDDEAGRIGSSIVREIAPLPEELVIQKAKPSAFFGTPLAAYLTAEHVDTVLVTGATTSGCVRATVVDAFSYNYRVIVVADCVFDRSDTSHRVALFELNAKYADVVLLDEVETQLNSAGRIPEPGV